MPSRSGSLLLVAALLHGLCAASTPTLAGEDATTPVPATPVVLPSESPSWQLAEDAVYATATGTTFQLSKGWFVSTHAGRVLLEDPDRELTLTLLEVTSGGEVGDGAAALASAWAVAQPGFSRAIRHAMNPPPRDGWDAITQQVYETGTEEKRTVIGVARQKGGTWYVGLIDAADAALDRRGAQLNTVLLSFRAPGAEKESFAGRKAHALDADRQARLADFIEASRVATRVPGAAVAVVQDGKVVFQRGFGVRDIGGNEPVTPATLFMIGSTTKSLTTLMMARLVDEGRTSWDRPVVDMYPGFALADPEVTRKLTLQNTVCACTGLPRQDMEMLFEYAGREAEHTIALMRTMKPTTGFGETFQYSNTMVSSGGYIAAHTAFPELSMGAAWDRAMQMYVYDPLGMTSTGCDFDRVARMNHASPHGLDLRDQLSRLDLAGERALIPVRPAGGAWSSLEDMSRYVAMELARGLTSGGKRFVSEENLLRRREPQVKITDEMSYGLGLFIEKDHDVSIIHHGGNTLGFTSDLFFLPDHGVGAVVLANAGGANTFRSVVRRRLLEILFDGRDEAGETLTYSLEQRRKVLAREIEEVTWTPDRAWLEGFAGSYANGALGRVDITMKGDEAVFDTGEWRSGLARKQGADGVVKLMLTSPPWAGLELIPVTRDGRTSLTLLLSQQEYTFEPVAR